MQTENGTQEWTHNLLDAGCRQQEIERFLGLVESGNAKEQLRMLSGIRAALLEAVHKREKQIDCLDYLVFQIQKNL